MDTIEREHQKLIEPIARHIDIGQCVEGHCKVKCVHKLPLQCVCVRADCTLVDAHTLTVVRCDELTVSVKRHVTAQNRQCTVIGRLLSLGFRSVTQ